MPRKFSLGCLLFAWLCANGALWNVVQVVAWVKMYHDFSQVMPAAQALRTTFDGSAPCELCVMTQKARETERSQLPRDTLPGGGAEKIVLLAEAAPAFVVTAPDLAWPGAVDAAGPARTERVPVPPPRA